MKIIATKHINKKDEKIAKKLAAFCNNSDECKDLFADTLSKLDTADTDAQLRNILNATSKNGHTDSEPQSYATSRFSRVKIYMPIAAVALLLAGGIFIGNKGFENDSTLSIINNSANKPDGSVATTALSLTAESSSELDIENQLQADTQASIDEIYNSTKSLGDISNEISL